MSEDRRRASGGVELTGERIAELADEAEAGYPPEQLRTRSRRGRPPLGSGAASVVHVRLPPELRAALEQAADAGGTTPSALLRRALEEFLGRRPGKRARKQATPRQREASRKQAGRVLRVDVAPTPRGGWVIKSLAAREGSGRFATQGEAIEAGRRILASRGGGELRIAGRDGRIRRTTRVRVGADDPR